jgi:hypothetical protein
MKNYNKAFATDAKKRAAEKQRHQLWTQKRFFRI